MVVYNAGLDDLLYWIILDLFLHFIPVSVGV